MKENPSEPNNSSSIESASEQDQQRLEFDKQYAKREKMDFKYGQFEYIDITPENQAGKDVYLATGTPWSWQQSEELIFQMLQKGHRVMAIGHSNYGSKNAIRYQPETQRPAAIEEFFKQKNVKNAIVVAHSFGFMDIARKGSKNIDGVVAINPAGLNENSRIAHIARSIMSIKYAIFKNIGTEKERKYYQKMLIDFISQSPVKSITEILNVGSANIDRELQDFVDVPIITLRNIDDAIVPINKVHDLNYRRLESGGNHLGPFIHKDQMDEIIRTIGEIEKMTKHGKNSKLSRIRNAIEKRIASLT